LSWNDKSKNKVEIAEKSQNQEKYRSVFQIMQMKLTSTKVKEQVDVLEKYNISIKKEQKSTCRSGF
jgi:hypothetical protein